MVRGHLFEDRKEVAADRRRDRTLQDLADRLVVGLHLRRKPQRCTRVIVGTVGAVVQKGAAPKRPGEAWHAGEVLVRIRPRPTRDGIGRKCQDKRIDDRRFVGGCRGPHTRR
jgi:hypothetical protein